MDKIEMLRFAIHAGDKTNDHVILNAILMGELGESAHYLLGAMPDGFLERLSESSHKCNCYLKNEWRAGIKAKSFDDVGDGRKSFNYDTASINEWWLTWCAHEGLKKLSEIPMERQSHFVHMHKHRFGLMLEGKLPIKRGGTKKIASDLSDEIYGSISRAIITKEEVEEGVFYHNKMRDEYYMSIRKKRFEMHALAAAKEELAKLLL